MNDINIKYYVDLLKKGGKIKAKKIDDTELTFYLNESGDLISEDEHGLTTETGLSSIELLYVISSSQNDGDYILEEIVSEELNEGSERTNQFENNIERAVLIGSHLRNLGYNLEDVYEMYNKNKDVMSFIDELSPQVLDLFENRNINQTSKTFQSYEKQSDLGILLNNLYDSGKVLIWDSNGESREYYIEGGMLFSVSNEGSTKEGFLAAARLKYDLDKVYLGRAEAGTVLPEVVFRDEKAMEKVEYGIATTRLFSDRLRYSLERFDEEYEENFEFKSLVDSSDESVWERTDSTEVASLNNVSRVAIVGITNSDISSFESSIERIETKEKVDKGEI